MPSNIQISFRVRNRAHGGTAAGRTLSEIAPDFDLTEFLKAPNAEEFIKKAYFVSVKKIIREIDENKNGTVKSDLSTYEKVVARSLSFTQDEIRDWLKSRDWTLAKEVKSMEKLLPQLEKKLPLLAGRRNHFSKEQSEKLADKVIAAVADVEDPVADFLFTTLTTPRTEPEDDFLLL